MKIKTQADLEVWIAELTAGEKNNLTTLDLRNTQVTDVTPLAALVNLTTLYLSHTQVTDVTPLAALVNLTIYR